MFDKEMDFYGKHATYLRSLAPSRQYLEKSDQRVTFFRSNIEVVLAAAVIGFVKQRKEPSEGNKEVAPNNIFAQALINHKDELELIYRLIMLLDDNDKLSIDNRIDKAFKYDADPEKSKAGEDIFWAYVRGGIEYLYENLYEKSDNTQEDIRHILEFVASYNATYSKENITKEILDLCRKAVND